MRQSHLSAGTKKGPASDSPRTWSYRWAVSHLTCVLGSKLRSSRKAVHAFNL